MRRQATDWTSRSLALVLGLACLILSCDTAHDPAIPPPEPPGPDHIVVDIWPTWSPDGNHIAYYRYFPSTDGPPGIYVIRSDGAGNRLVLAGGGIEFWLLYLRYTPDGAGILARIGSGFQVIDVKTGETRPLGTSSGFEPDISPDGRSVVYRALQELRIADIETGQDRSLGAGIIGADPKWSPAGEPIAFSTGSYGEGVDIFTINSDGSSLTRRTHIGDAGYTGDPRWLYGGTHLMYRFADGSKRETRVILPDGQTIVWPLHIGHFDAISPDCRHIITTAAQDDSIAVLFTREIDDVQGTTLRQVTSYTAK